MRRSSPLSQAFRFARSQPALRSVGFWLIFLPLLAMNVLIRFADVLRQENSDMSNVLGLIVLALFAGVLLVWGTACILLIGKRLLRSGAGRSRTSFRAVTRQASGFVIPLLLTGILRGCITTLWSLLLVVPGIIYNLSTIFYPVVVVCEGLSYRPALQRSNQILKGQWWKGVLRILWIAIILFVPFHIVLALLELTVQDFWQALILDFAGSAVDAFLIVIFTLTTIVVYRDLKKNL